MDELTAEVGSLLQVALPPAALNPEPDWAEATMRTVLKLDNREPEKKVYGGKQGNVASTDHVRTPAYSRPRRPLPVFQPSPLHDNNLYIAEFARRLDLPIAYATSLTWTSSTSSLGRHRLTLASRDIVASHAKLPPPERLPTSDKFYEHVVNHGRYEYINARPSASKLSYCCAVSICATCRLCCGQERASHIHRVVVVVIGLSLDGCYGDGQDGYQWHDFYKASWKMVRDKLQYPRKIEDSR